MISTADLRERTAETAEDAAVSSDSEVKFVSASSAMAAATFDDFMAAVAAALTLAGHEMMLLRQGDFNNDYNIW